MASKALLLLGLLFALVCFVSSEVATQQLAAKDAEKNVEDQKYGGGYPGGGYPGRGGGGYPGGGYPGRGGGGYPGGGYPGRGGGGYPGGGYPGRGGGGYPGHGGGGYPGHGGGGCYHGCCRRGYRGCICCGSADEVPEPEYQPEVNN